MIKIPECHRPGLSLTGYLKFHDPRPLLIFGKLEVSYLNDLQADTRISRLSGILTKQTPAVIVSDRVKPQRELCRLCDEKEIPLFRTALGTIHLLES